ncbi:MAG: carbon storage regulator [Candidatus Kapabacteria bacterium]|nr:carbon storage regulator [Candidatus Kapabacteria bacterium]
MLALTLKPGERVFIGDNVVIHARIINDTQVRIIFDAPRSVVIKREKVNDKIQSAGCGHNQTEEQGHRVPDGTIGA